MSGYIEELEENGFTIINDIFSEEETKALATEVNKLRDAKEASKEAGLRDILKQCPFVREFALQSKIYQIVETFFKEPADLIKAIYFNKTPEVNWKVPYHQDVTIAVKQAGDFKGFGPWTIKNGINHVQAPTEILQRIIAVRCHLDDSLEANGTIKVIPGSHKLGKLPAPDIAKIYSKEDEVICNAPKGSVMLMSPLLIHASSKGGMPSNRRVLHFEYTTANLPHGCEWYESYMRETA